MGNLNRGRRSLLLIVAVGVALSSSFFLFGCKSEASPHPWEKVPLWDFALREMNARQPDTEQTDARVLTSAQDYLESLEPSESAALFDTTNPVDVVVRSAAVSEESAISSGYAAAVYLVVDYAKEGASTRRLIQMTAVHRDSASPYQLMAPARADKTWFRKLSGMSREDVELTLGEATGASGQDEMAYELLRGERLRPQWLVVEFESGRVSGTRMELDVD